MANCLKPLNIELLTGSDDEVIVNFVLKKNENGSYTVKGNVTGEGLEIIEGAVISFWKDETSITTVTTDENGNYAFMEVSPGTYNMSAEKDGYKREEREVKVPE